MKLRIDASSAFVKKYLQVDDRGVLYSEAFLFSGARRFAFHQIDAILMSETGLLSIQVGREVFSLQTKAGRRKQQEAMAALVQEVEKSRPPRIEPPNPAQPPPLYDY
jgi:hypothetical protein